MAFPFLSEYGAEQGTIGHFDALSDSTGALDYAHYSALAAVPGLAMPYRGAYCLRVNLKTKSTTDAYLQETGSWDTSASGTIFFRLMFWISPTITMANADEFCILQLWSGTNTIEGGAYINFTTANGLRIGIGETAATSLLPLSTGVWHCLELKFVIDSGVGNDGTIDGWLDGSTFTQVTALDQGAITSGIVGVVGQDAGTTAGVVMFDDIIADDAQIFPPTIRFPTTIMLTASGHAFVGPGDVINAELMSGAGTDNVLSMFDTDVGFTSDASNIKGELKNTANTQMVPSFQHKLHFSRGCYVSLTGTNPRALLQIAPKVAYSSDGAIRTYGAHRVPFPRAT